MLVKKALNTEIMAIESTDTIEAAMGKLDRYRVSTHPVIDATTRKLVGQLSRADLERVEGEGELVSDLPLTEAVKIYELQHLFESVRLMLQYERFILPVIDDEWTFLGVVTKQDILESLGRMLNLAQQGSVITISMDAIDFSLAEVVQLIETEGAKILGVTVEAPAEDDKRLEISIKLNIQDVSRVASALRRYGYSVMTESVNEAFGLNMEDRADELIKYLDM